MAYPLPYKLFDWAGYDRNCPDHTGVMTTNTYFLGGGTIYWVGWSPSAGSSTNTSIAKTLIGGVQNLGSAVVTGVYLDLSVPGLNNKMVFRLNNGDNNNTNPPDSWQRLVLQWVTSGVTYTQDFDRSSATLARLNGAYIARDWAWIWPNPTGNSTPVWSPPQNNKSVTWTITQSLA